MRLSGPNYSQLVKLTLKFAPMPTGREGFLIISIDGREKGEATSG
jgi:hypothetical protein